MIVDFINKLFYNINSWTELCINYVSARPQRLFYLRTDKMKKYYEKDLIDKKFGRLIIIKEVKNNKDNRRMVICKCEECK